MATRHVFLYVVMFMACFFWNLQPFIIIRIALVVVVHLELLLLPELIFDVVFFFSFLVKDLTVSNKCRM